jgi:phosphoglycerate dehydrogenase-like enzyme
VAVTERPELCAALRGADAFVLENSRYDAEVARWVAESPLRWIQLLSSGYENLVRHGVPDGVTVTNAAGVRSGSVAEHGVALLLALAHAVPAISREMQHERWQPGLASVLRSLEGATALIVGYGDIGRELARRLASFGVRIIAANRSPVADPIVEQAFGLGRLDEALALADIVALSVAYVPQTHHLLSAARLAAARPGALLLNVSRGGVVDTEALVDALESGRLGGAALDVTDPEPLPPGHPLWRTKNVLISPHLGGTATAASNERLCRLVVENARRIASGKAALGRVQLGRA